MAVLLLLLLKFICAAAAALAYDVCCACYHAAVCITTWYNDTLLWLSLEYEKKVMSHIGDKHPACLRCFDIRVHPEHGYKYYALPADEQACAACFDMKEKRD